MAPSCYLVENVLKFSIEKRRYGCPLPVKVVMLMMTYGNFFEFCLVVIGIIGLFLADKRR